MIIYHFNAVPVVNADSLGIDCHAGNAIISKSSVMSLNMRIFFSQNWLGKSRKIQRTGKYSMRDPPGRKKNSA